MADFFETFRDWLHTNSGDLVSLLDASAELAERLEPKARRANRSVAQLVNQDAVTVRALADGVGLAEIAGQRQLDGAQVLEALAMTVKFATLIGGAL